MAKVIASITLSSNQVYEITDLISSASTWTEQIRLLSKSIGGCDTSSVLFEQVEALQNDLLTLKKYFKHIGKL